MRAVVKYLREDGNTEVRDVPVPETGPSDVLVKVGYIGICGSDPHMYHNQVSYPMAIPVILGHEFSGTIEKVGADVKQWKPGDRVTAETHARFCGKCVLCKTNNYRFCRERKGYGFAVDGAFAEYVCVPERILHAVPESISLRDASCTEPVCVAYNVVIAKTGVKAGDSVAVLGPGPIGILCVLMAKIAGASRIVVFGAPGDEKRLDIARLYGATETYTLDGATDPKAVAAKFNEGYGFNSVIDAAGPAATLKISMDIVMPTGIINKVAWGPKPVDLSLDPLLSKGVTLQGSFSHTWDIWEKVLVLMAQGQTPLDALITHELPLEEWKHGFDLIERREGLKVVLKP